jgi:hypothetical protein
MATTSKVLARTAAATSNTTIYTVPTTSTVTVVTDVLVANTATSTSTVTINLDGIAILSGTSVPPNDAISLALKQVLPANATPKTITASASTTAVTIHVSGVEIV